MSDRRAFASLVDYHVLRGRSIPPLTAAAGYDYLVAGNGLFKRAENIHLGAILPVTTARLPFLSEIGAGLVLKRGKIPAPILGEIAAAALKRAKEDSHAAMFFVVHDGEAYRWVRPESEEARVGSVRYERTRQDDIIMEIHSHHEMDAFFSETDDADELGFRLYGVLGRLTTRPTLRVRLGIHGDRWEVGPAQLFEGTLALHTDGPDGAETTDSIFAAPAETAPGRYPCGGDCMEINQGRPRPETASLLARLASWIERRAERP